MSGIWGMGLLFVLASAAYAQSGEGPASRYRAGSLLDQVISTLVFSLLGIGLTILGFKLFDLVIKFDIEREICEKNNIAAAILAGAVVLGICLIVGFVVIS